MRLKPVYDGYTVKLPNTATEMEDIGCLTLPRNVARLIALRAFIYQEEAGQISVRLERKTRGSALGYWVAYKRMAGKLRKTYVCEAEELDPYNLDDAALRLLYDGAVIRPRQSADCSIQQAAITAENFAEKTEMTERRERREDNPLLAA